MNAANDPRIVRLDGAKNVRDLGGLTTVTGETTRFGVIYRADGLSRLTDDDLTRLAQMRLRTVIDLRYDEERRRAPDRVPAEQAPAFYHCGFLPQGTLDVFEGVNRQGCGADAAFDLMVRNYQRIPFDHAAEFGALMRHVVAPDTAPHLIHCTSGKDRTGLAVAFILLSLGVTLDEVVADYELSNGDWQAVDVFGPRAKAEAIAVVMAAKRAYLIAALDAIDERCGSFEAYLDDCLQFGPEPRAALRRLLLN